MSVHYYTDVKTLVVDLFLQGATEDDIAQALYNYLR